MEIVIGDQTHVLTVYPDSNLKQLTKQFARQRGLPANMEQQLYEEVDAQYQENFMDDWVGLIENSCGWREDFWSW